MFPNVAAAYLVRIDHREFGSHRANLRLPPASLTKIMTALLALELGQLQNTVTVSPRAAAETGTRLGLRAGEQFRAADLLAATLLQSANDACHALAEHLAGSERAFVARMNRRAVELGLSDTHFANACGHDDPLHYSSAHDLARLAEAALAQPVFADLTARVEASITTRDGRRSFHLVNKNELVGRYPGAIGVKSGYTPQAGKCLVAYARRDKTVVMAVLLNAPDRWWTAVAMLDRAFAEARTLQATSP
jgi:D-alanyl-D-alanine carboxypeptidase (penicillin-binding protein 5/6)